MRLVAYARHRGDQTGAVIPGGIVDLNGAYRALPQGRGTPRAAAAAQATWLVETVRIESEPMGALENPVAPEP